MLSLIVFKSLKGIQINRKATAIFETRKPSKIFKSFNVNRTDGEFSCDNDLTFSAVNSDQAVTGMITYTDTALDSTREISDWLNELEKENYTVAWVDDEGQSSYFFCSPIQENPELIEFVVVNSQDKIEFQGILLLTEFVEKMRTAITPVPEPDTGYDFTYIRKLWGASQKKD